MLYSTFLLSSQKVAAPSSLKSDLRAVIAAISGVVPTMFMTASIISQDRELSPWYWTRFARWMEDRGIRRSDDFLWFCPLGLSLS